ncbi:MAG: MoaD/ThiS family protein [Candidatus Lokiarchaeota archaeon]|nr:MoaD/ThiS family protein [Candidatus Lokiarchaeota archaeon]
MTILVKIFGDLRKKIKDVESDGALPLNLHMNTENIEYIKDILQKLSIEENETSHIFVNGVYAGFNKKVKDGDRVGFFSKNQALLYKWYFKREEDD